MSLEKEIMDSVRERTNVPAPAVDVAALTRRGRRRVAVQRAAVGLVAVAALVAGGGVVSALNNPHPAPDRPAMVPAGQLHYDDGLRAYMDPGSGKIQLGGSTVAIKGEWALDTDAVATPYGLIAFEKNRRPYLLEESGTLTPLSPAPDAADKKFYPHARVDAERPVVAWAEYDGGDAVRIRLYDLEKRTFAAETTVPCDSPQACRKVRLRALDQGLVFVRTPDGNQVWNPGSDEWTALGGSQIADVRNKVVMMTGEFPSESQRAALGAGWRFVKGEIDAQLSHDGRWKLYWSTKLTPTSGTGESIELDVPSPGPDTFVTFDTDGSVLVASGSRGEITNPDSPSGAPHQESDQYRVYDCEIPSGECTQIGKLAPTGGDPLFVGNDM